jgi:tripartite-type tricarboxylate transporter receptor subunit TctC
MNRKALAVICTSWLCLLVMAPVYAADDYPNRPITLIVPFPPGGGNDALARIVAEKMSSFLDKPIVVENRVGGAGTLGTRFVAKSPPDGYTLLLGFTGSIAINPTLIPGAGIDPVKDYQPVGRIGSLPLILVVYSGSKFKTLSELVEYAKRNPGKVNYASSGTGTTIHLASEMLAREAGIELTHIPYRGTGPAITDVLGGQVDMFMSTVGAASQNIKAGTLRALAAISAARLDGFPDVPTIAEAGYPRVSGMSLYGILAPAGTSKLVVERLNRALNKALILEDVKSRLAGDAVLPLPGDPDDYRRDLEADADTWGAMVRTLGLKVEE